MAFMARLRTAAGESPLACDEICVVAASRASGTGSAPRRIRRFARLRAAETAVANVPEPSRRAPLITSGHPFRICRVLAGTEVTHRTYSAAEPAAAVFLESHP